MTEQEETCSLQVIEFCRRFNRQAAEKYVEVGASVEDIAIGALYSAYDLALAHTGDPIAAIEWLRRGIDVQAEQFLLHAETVQ
jgi:hypothetical protein